jgi:hypothetical protein
MKSIVAAPAFERYGAGMKFPGDQALRPDSANLARLEELVKRLATEAWDFRFMLADIGPGGLPAGRLLILRECRVECELSSFGVFADMPLLIDGLAGAGVRWFERALRARGVTP